MKQPYVIDRKRWAKLSIFDQMGNIYSEVGRSFNARRQNNSHDCQAAINRAVSLFDETIDALIAQKSPKAKEVLRAKEEYLRTINDSHASQERISSLDRYFLQFAVAARLGR
jgi:hypothetical protein